MISGKKLSKKSYKIRKIYNIHDLVNEIKPSQKQSEVDWGKPEGKEILTPERSDGNS